MRICSNSDKNIEKFNASYYAKEWVDKGDWRAEEKTRPGRKPPTTPKSVIDQDMDISEITDEKFDQTDIDIMDLTHPDSDSTDFDLDESIFQHHDSSDDDDDG